MNKMNPARVDRDDERRMLPCRNFLDGFCPKGTRCRFFHPAVSSIPTVIRVPNLPSSFQQNNFGQFPVHPHSGPHSVFSYSPSRSHMGMSPKLGSIGSPGASRFLGMNGFGGGNYARNTPAPVPPSPTYSEYDMAYAQHMEIQKEKERRASAPPLQKFEDEQDTVFNHIDWREFLTPGALPPPPTNVPYIGTNSPRQPNNPLDSVSLDNLLQETEIGKAGAAEATDLESFFAERMAADYKILSAKEKHSSPPKIKEFVPQTKSSRTLSAKEELQQKVQQIAKELAAEPANHAQSLDTFFRNYTFQSIPTAPSSEQDLAYNGSCELKETGSDNSVPCANSNMNILKAEAIAFVPKSAFSTSDSELSSGTDSGGSVCLMSDGDAAEPDAENPAHEDIQESPN